MAQGGCKYGIATQDSKNVSLYDGHASSVEDFIFFLAHSTYKIVNQLGCNSLQELRGKAIDYVDLSKDHVLQEYSFLLDDPYPNTNEFLIRSCIKIPSNSDISAIDQLKKAIINHEEAPYQLTASLNEGEISFGSALSAYCETHAINDPITVTLLGGHPIPQNCGTWLRHNITIKGSQSANDHLGKGLSGGTIVLAQEDKNDIPRRAGNSILYGAMAGDVFLTGSCGTRGCVRNSGANIVIGENVGEHFFEFVTAGTGIVLGNLGDRKSVV